VGSYALSSNATSTFKLQGYLGTSWIDLSSPVANTTTNVIFPITSTDTSTVYSKFRLIGVAGTNTWSYINELSLVPSKQFQSSLYPKEACAVDSDNDGIPNHRDLDSDGDGCSDANEASATTSKTANFQFTGSVGTNGLADNLETAIDNGTINYKSTYSSYATSNTVSTCIDTDNDGIGDVIDIDDDNDGIPDHMECYPKGSAVAYNPSSAIQYFDSNGNKLSNCESYPFTASGVYTFVCNGLNAPNLYGNSILTQVNGVPVLENTTVSCTVDQSGMMYKAKDNIAVIPNTQYTFSINLSWTNYAPPSIRFKINGVFYTPTNPSGSSTAESISTIAVTWNSGASSQITSFEIYNDQTNGCGNDFKFTLPIGYTGSYQEAINNLANPPAQNCDLDNDGIPNSLDLDSDGDGCSDAYESGATSIKTPNYQFTGAVGANGFINSLETAIDNGVINYAYSTYAFNSTSNTCVDTDNDGIADIIDIDDDNDGVLDTTEDCDASAASTNQLNTSTKFTSAPTTVSGDTQIGYSYTPTGISFNPGATVGQHNGVALLGPFTSTGVTVNLSAIVRKDWAVSSYGGVTKGLFEILNSSQTVVGSLSWENSTATGSTDANNQTITLSGVVPSGNYYIRIKDNGSTSTSSGWGDDWSVKELTISTQKCNWDLDNDGYLTD
jgi:hypothetical protein